MNTQEKATPEESPVENQKTAATTALKSSATEARATDSGVGTVVSTSQPATGEGEPAKKTLTGAFPRRPRVWPD